MIHTERERNEDRDFRLFKLNRMDDIVHVADFEGNREVPMPDLSNEKVFPAKDRVKALFDPSVKNYHWISVIRYPIKVKEE